MGKGDAEEAGLFEAGEESSEEGVVYAWYSDSSEFQKMFQYNLKFTLKVLRPGKDKESHTKAVLHL